MLLQNAGKRVAGEIRIFLFPQVGQRIETLEFVVDMTGMAHDHAAVRQVLAESPETARRNRRSSLKL